MLYKDIIKLGNPNLRHISQSIPKNELNSQETKKLIQSLFDHMAHYGGVGLAAPQIGIKKRVFVYGFDKSPRYPGEGPVPLTAVINPKVTPVTKEQIEGFEGCLSVRTLRGKVPRYKALVLEGYQRDGSDFKKEVIGFEARIIQHELDHLDGLTFVDRIKDFKEFGFTDELKAFGVVD